jgi:hypothetical protein
MISADRARRTYGRFLPLQRRRSRWTRSHDVQRLERPQEADRVRDGEARTGVQRQPDLVAEHILHRPLRELIDCCTLTSLRSALELH